MDIRLPMRPRSIASQSGCDFGEERDVRGLLEMEGAHQATYRAHSTACGPPSDRFFLR
jgi:hypothetical protein